MRRRKPPPKDQRDRFADTFSGGHCRRKVRYPTRQAARDARRRLEKTTKAPFSHYRCRQGCGGWHVGHSEEWIAEQRKRRARRAS